MSIQISADGVSKTYRYYPYDAFYVNGQQVKEAWANGTKYYPDGDGGIFGEKVSSKITDLKITYRTKHWSELHTVRTAVIGTFRISYAYVATFDNTKFYRQSYANRSSILNRVSSDLDQLEGPTAQSLKLLARVQADFDPGTMSNDPPEWDVFNYGYLTPGSQALYNSLKSGIIFELDENDVVFLKQRRPENISEGVAATFASGATGSYRKWRYSSGPPSISLIFRFDPDKLPTLKYEWDIAPDGSQYPLIINIGHARATAVPFIISSDNIYFIQNNSYDSYESQSASLYPTGMNIDESDLYPLPS